MGTTIVLVAIVAQMQGHKDEALAFCLIGVLVAALELWWNSRKRGGRDA